MPSGVLKCIFFSITTDYNLRFNHYTTVINSSNAYYYFNILGGWFVCSLTGSWVEGLIQIQLEDLGHGIPHLKQMVIELQYIWRTKALLFKGALKGSKQ